MGDEVTEADTGRNCARCGLRIYGEFDIETFNGVKCSVHAHRCPEPEPAPNDSTPIWDLVIEDMRRRDHLGRKRYGTPLQAGNGRDALQDAYEEALDLAVYLRQAIEERDGYKEAKR